MRKALFVGINNYGANSLSGCVNDAEAMSRALNKRADGTPNFAPMLLTNTVCKAQLRNSINNLFEYQANVDVVLFYFSGHGCLDSLGGHLVTSENELLSMHDIISVANQSKIENKIIILDCCFSGNCGNKIDSGLTSELKIGTTILTSSMEHQTSMERNGHGMFTALLLEGLSGGAANFSGIITVGSLYSYIDFSLGPWYQRPMFKTHIGGFVELQTTTPQVSPAIMRKLTEYFASPELNFPLDPSFEDTNSPDAKHKLCRPYAKTENVKKFKDLQALQSIGLVTPNNAAFMYYAAMESKSCKLTPLGVHYWKLVKENKI